MASSDILAGIIAFPSYIYSYSTSGTVGFNKTYINVVGFFTLLGFHVSIFSLVAAAIDRFKALYRPLKYNAKATVTIARKICLGLWLISILLAIAPTGIFYKNFTFVLISNTVVLPVVLNNVYVFCIYAAILITAPIAAMWIFTILTFCVYKTHSKKQKKRLRTERQRLKSLQEIKFFFTLCIMVGAFSICLLPSAILTIIVITTLKLNPSAVISSTVILTSNSLWNFFIYSAREKKFRAASKSLYKKLRFCLK